MLNFWSVRFALYYGLRTGFRGMASTPKMEYQVFLCIFQKNSAMATLCLKEMGNRAEKEQHQDATKKICTNLILMLWGKSGKVHTFWEGHKILRNWDSQQTGQTFSLPSQRNFPISFKPKVAIAEFIGKMQKKWVGRHASFPPRWSVKWNSNKNAVKTERAQSNKWVSVPLLRLKVGP